MTSDPSVATAVRPGDADRATPEDDAATQLQRLFLYALVAVPLIVSAIALLPELTVGAPSQNDDAFQFLMIQRASDALSNGRNPLDFWMPQLELGFPQFLYYQNLPHLSVVALNRLLLGSVDLLTTFNLVRYILLVALPVTVFWSMRRMGFSMVSAAVSAACASLISGATRYGFEFDSYIWRGYGMYTQLWAMHLSFIALACVHRVINRGTGYVAAILALTALALSHLVYVYMMAASAVLIVIVGTRRRTLAPRAVRLAIVGAFAAIAASYMLVPFLASSEYLSASPYLQSWKYDSFGAPTILGWLVSGDLLDHGRLPVLTALLGVGIVAALLRRKALDVLALAGFAIWLILYFGRPTLGGLVDLLPMHDGLLIHRFIGSVELFGILLIGIGGEAAWKAIQHLPYKRRAIPLRSAAAIALAATVVVLTPAIVERWNYYAANTTWMSQTKAALDDNTDLKAVLATIQSKGAGGRTYAGLRTNWGSSMTVGPYVHVTDMLTFDQIPAVSPPYQSLSLNSDMLWDFRDGDVAMYDLLDVRYVIVPSNFTVPAFYRELQRTPTYALYQTPTSGVAEYVSVTSRQSAPTQRALFDGNVAWFRSAIPDAKQFIRWDFRSPSGPFQASAGCPDGGHTYYERDEADAIHLAVGCSVAAPLVLKVTYHPNWHVTVDGQPVETYMLSPSFVGINLPAGRHQVDAVYLATPSKLPLLGAGIVALLGAVLLRRRLDWLTSRAGTLRFRPKHATEVTLPEPGGAVDLPQPSGSGGD